MRLHLLALAGRTVTERGMVGLSLRTLAAEAGTSTTAVYSLFGSKSALLGALYEESFTSFGAAQRAVPSTGVAVTDLVALGQAYWAWARRHPHLYGVMFGASLAGFECTPEQAAAAEATIGPLADVVGSAVRSGVLIGDPAVITFAIWAAVHGVVSLVMAGRAPDDEAASAGLFAATAMAAVRGWLAQPAEALSGSGPARSGSDVGDHRGLHVAVQQRPGLCGGQP